MNIKDVILSYQKSGYGYADAEAKVSQDIILFKIANSRYRDNITVKGGVVLHNISNDIRRATRDLDIDFIKYSLSDDSICNFIVGLNVVDDDIQIEITGNIMPLHHQDYDGKRVHIRIKDKYDNKIDTKLDIGVHKLFDLEQDEYCFDLRLINQKVQLFINSKEQIFTEKLKSLLKLGFRSTRYKDIFDFYYLIHITGLNQMKLLKNIDILIIQDNGMRENTLSDIVIRLDKIFSSPRYLSHLSNPVVNWLNIPIEEAIHKTLEYMKMLDK